MPDPHDQSQTPIPAHPEPAPPPPAPTPPPPQNSRRPLGIVVTVALLLLLLIAGGALTAALMLGTAMGMGDSCSFTPQTVHCLHGDVPYVVDFAISYLPPLGLIAALLLGSIGAAISIRRNRTGLPWAGLAWATFIAALGAETALTTIYL